MHDTKTIYTYATPKQYTNTQSVSQTSNLATGWGSASSRAEVLILLELLRARCYRACGGAARRACCVVLPAYGVGALLDLTAKVVVLTLLELLGARIYWISQHGE